MKKLFLILSLLFAILTFAGAIYVLTSKGEANAGFAVIPMTLSLGSFSLYKAFKRK
ncbi:MAG: hypothetical protein IKA57_01200 [Clostridia bacterium]|nr:hypothetical protein [Clostridia bacterium]